MSAFLNAGKASGGEVFPGRTYVVGERGPELVRFREPGQVFSHTESVHLIARERERSRERERLASVLRERVTLRAMGGAVRAGQPYLVGEQGAELVRNVHYAGETKMANAYSSAS